MLSSQRNAVARQMRLKKETDMAGPCYILCAMNKSEASSFHRTLNVALLFRQRNLPFNEMLHPGSVSGVIHFWMTRKSNNLTEKLRLPLHMRNDHMLNNQTPDFCWVDGEAEEEGWVSESEGSWSLDIKCQSQKTEIWSLVCSLCVSVCLYSLRRSVNGPSLFSVLYMRILISEYLYPGLLKVATQVKLDGTEAVSKIIIIPRL